MADELDRRMEAWAQQQRKLIQAREDLAALEAAVDRDLREIEYEAQDLARDALCAAFPEIRRWEIVCGGFGASVSGVARVDRAWAMPAPWCATASRDGTTTIVYAETPEQALAQVLRPCVSDTLDGGDK